MFRHLAAALCILLALTLSPAVATASSPVLGDPDEFEAFADAFMEAALERYRVPGAVLIAVRDGRFLYAKGHGYADLEQQIPWDPDQTVFRAKSISKLVTATATMQVAERGLLDLHADSRDKLPMALEQPLTAANLLTHTGGFSDRGVAINVHDPAELMPLEALSVAGPLPAGKSPW